MKPMNCPGHMLLFGSQLRSYRDLPLRYAEASTAAPQRARRDAARPHARPVRDAGRRAHLLHAGADRRGARRRDDVPAATSTTCSGSSRGPSSRRGPTTSSAPTRSGTSRRASCSRRSSATRSSTSSARARGVLRAEDRPPHDRRRSAGRGRWGRSSSTPRCPSASGSRTWAPTTSSTPVRRPPRVYSARSSGSSGILIEHYAGALPTWLAPVQVRVLPVAEAHRRSGRRARRRSGLAGVRAEADERDETLGKRIRDAELQKIPYVVVWGDRETREAMAVRGAAAKGVETMSLDGLVEEIDEQGRAPGLRPDAASCRASPGPTSRVGATLRPCKQERHRPSPRRPRAARGSTESDPTRECRRCMQVAFSRNEEDRLGLVNCL